METEVLGGSEKLMLLIPCYWPDLLVYGYMFWDLNTLVELGCIYRPKI